MEFTVEHLLSEAQALSIVDTVCLQAVQTFTKRYQQLFGTWNERAIRNLELQVHSPVLFSLQLTEIIKSIRFKIES